MCLSRELCELRTFPQIVHVLTADVVLCERMWAVSSLLEVKASLHTGQMYF